MQLHYFKEGERIGGDFEVVQRHDTGGMGQVYLCYSHARDYFYALKGLNRRTFPIFAYDPFQFRREIETWIGLGEHENIVRCFTVLMLQYQPFIVAEWVGDDRELAMTYQSIHRGQPHFLDWYARLGESGIGLRKTTQSGNSASRGVELESWMAQRVFHGNPTLALEVVLDICAGLIHINRVFPGATHADLKPANILMTRQGRAKISDFGITALPGLLVTGDTAPPLGSPLHMAPEQWLNQPLDCRTDIYAVGVILFSLLMEYEPFDADYPHALRQKHLRDPIPWISSCVPGSEQLNEIVHQCLAKAPSGRFDSPTALYTALADVYRTLPRAGMLPEHHSTEPNTVEQFNQLGIAYTWLGSYAKADKQFREAAARDPLQASTFLNRGIVAAHQDRLSDALRDFNQALRFSHRLAGFDHHPIKEHVFSKAKYNIAVTYFMRGDYGRALEEIEHTHLEQESLVTRAAIYIAMGQFDSAIADCSTVLTQWPSFALALFNRGLAHLCQGNAIAAQADIDKAEIGSLRSLVVEARATQDVAKLRNLARTGDFLPSLSSVLGPAGAQQKAEFRKIVAQRDFVVRIDRPPFEPFLQVTDVAFSDHLHSFVRSQTSKGEVTSQLQVRGTITYAEGATANEILGLRISSIMTPLPSDVREFRLSRMEEWEVVVSKQFQLVLDMKTSQLFIHAGLHSLDDLVGRELRLQYIDPDDRSHPLRVFDVLR